VRVKHLLLDSNWQVKQRDLAQSLASDFAISEGWLPANVPGTVQQDLLAAGRILDPFIGRNEEEVQWVGECDWLYRCTFDLPVGFEEAEVITLCFDGLDTFSTVWLNGVQVLVSDNMFIPHRVQVGGRDKSGPYKLRPGSNSLHLLFESALRIGQERQAQYGMRTLGGKGDTDRVYVRKAQYHYGWDWGPTLLTTGPWRPIRLEAHSIRISDFTCPADVAADLNSATLPVSITLETSNTSPSVNMTLQVALHTPAGEIIDEVLFPVTGSEMQHTFKINSPELWWPNGYGRQPLYRLVATLKQDTEEIDQYELGLGLRRLQLIQRPLEDEPGTTFLFEINNTPIFCSGANWIPADSFLPRISHERYRKWLQLAASANMVMLRLWGGGIYKSDIFYDLCDELGLLVWQDFMFACGLYPALNWFQESVRSEAEASVRHLRHHPCIALWCGNNEDYMIANAMGVYDPSFEGDFITTQFPARAIYEHLLPQVCAALDPTRPYWPGSPYGGSNVNDPTVGDQHVWDVWHGKVADYHDYPRFSGRFVSEFGMQAFPDIATIASVAPPTERYPQSRTLDHHNKALDGPRRLAAYLIDNVRIPADLEGYIYATQFVQAEALAAAIRGWRRRWRGPGREAVAGALIWQLDDCWPVTSWALVDYLFRPKPAYYVVRREFAPLTVGLAQLSKENAEVWAVNGTTDIVEAELEVQLWTLEGELVAQERQPVTLAPNQATELGQPGFRRGDSQVLAARLFQQGEVVARTTLWPEPFKYLTLPDPGIKIEHLDADLLRIHATRPAKGVWLSAGDEVQWSDNMLDLLPGDAQTIKALQLGETEVQARWLR
jgi:beta-mannosidase